MGRKSVKELKPFLSVVMVISLIFAMVFIKMETRRLGYSVLKEAQALQKLKDQYKIKKLRYITLTRPDRIKKFAVSQLTLVEAQKGQIIQIMGNKVALKQ